VADTGIPNSGKLTGSFPGNDDEPFWFAIECPVLKSILIDHDDTIEVQVGVINQMDSMATIAQ